MFTKIATSQNIDIEDEDDSEDNSEYGGEADNQCQLNKEASTK